MKYIRILLSLFLLLAPLSMPARADFKYTETTQITGGSLQSLTKFAGVFSKQARQATKPLSSSHYIKGDRMRTDNSDGTIQIIDLPGRRFITIDTMKNTYYVVTFDDMKANMDRATAQVQQKTQPDPNAKNAQANIDAQFHVTPGTETREIMGQPTNEVKMEMDITFTAQQQPDAAQQQPGGQASGTMVTNMDTFVAPSVRGYEEFAEFYGRMAKEIDWTPPSNIHVDPRTTQGLGELEKNAGQLRGFPLLKYISMTMRLTNPDGTPVTVPPPDASQNNPPPSNTSSNNSSSNTSITSPSDAIAKGLGGLFNRKKKQDDSAAQAAQSDPNAPPPPPPTPGSLMEMTVQVSSFSTDSLDSSLFDIPAAYTLVQPPAAMAPGGGAGTRK